MPPLPSEPLTSAPSRRRWAVGLALALHVASGGWLLSSKGVGPYFYDERFTLENVRRIVLQGHPVPTSYFWYAPLSYLPQTMTLVGLDHLGAALGSARLDTLQTTGDPTPLGIRIARSFGILFGCLTLVALHALVRRLWDSTAADFAAIALAASPWFTRGNAEFKPDALLVLLCVMVFVPLTRYLLDDSTRSRRLAAVLAGAAAAAKLNGVLAVVPLGLAGWSEPTGRWRLTRTLESAAIAITSFLLLNPWPRSALHYLGKVDQQWDQRAEDLDFLGMLGTMLGKLFQINYFGPFVGAAVAFGLLLTLRDLRPRGGAARTRAARALWLLYPAVYLLALCASTRYPKENNLLPVLPFAAALAGVACAALVRRTTSFAPRAAAVLLPAFALFGVATLGRFMLAETTEQLADRQVREVRRELGRGYGHVIAWWGGADAERELANSGWNGPPPLLLPLDAALLGERDRVDRLDCVGGYGTPPAAVASLLPAAFELRRYGGAGLRGSRLVQRTARPWHGCSPWVQVPVPVDLRFETRDGGWLEAPIPAPLPDYDAFTLNGRYRVQESPLEIEVAGRPFAARAVGLARQRWVLLGSERAVGALAGTRVRVRPEGSSPPNLEILLWLRPGSRAPIAGDGAGEPESSAPAVPSDGESG